MKRIDELVNEAYPDELARVEAETVNEEAVRAKTFAKLGLTAELAGTKAEVKPLRAVRKRRGLRATIAAVGVMAACIAVLFTTNAVFPAFAESLPGIGSLFRAINALNGPAAFNGENVSRVEELMAPVSEAKTTAGEGGLSFTVQEAYYDGKYLYCAAQIETELDPNAAKTDWRYKVFINGKQLDFGYHPYERDWVKTGENTYANDEMSTLIPEEYRPAVPGDIRVKFEVEFIDLSHTKPAYDTHGQEVTEIIPETLAAAAAEFTAKYDPGETVELQSGAEQNGVKLLSFSTSPAGTEVAMDVPRELQGNPEEDSLTIELFLEDGRQITLNSGSTGYSDLSEDALKLVYSGEGMPGETTRAVATLLYSDSAPGTDVLAEFTIDLERQTAVPSEHWKDLDDPLYWSREADLSPNRVFASYRAKDSDLQELDSGYRVEFLTYMDGLYAPFANLVTDRDYRDLHVELLDKNGAVWAAGDTAGTMEMEGHFTPAERVMFQPFAQYDFTYYDSFQNQMEHATEEDLASYRKYFGEQKLSRISGGDIPREMDKSGLNSQAVFLQWGDHFPLAGERYTVRVTDPASGELVHQETVEMTLPENLELGEGQRLIKLRGPYNPYVILDEE